MQTIPPEILERVDALADRLGVTASNLFETLSRQASVEAYSWPLAWVVGLATALVIKRALWRRLKRAKAEGEDMMEDPVCIILSIVLGAGSIGLLIAGMAGLASVIGRIANPDYYAMREILRAFGG